LKKSKKGGIGNKIKGAYKALGDQELVIEVLDIDPA